MPVAGEVRPRHRQTDIDAIAITQRIATEWETAGVDPAWVKIIREPQTWRNCFNSDLPPIMKLVEDLQRTGEFFGMRRQAIRLFRGTDTWQKLLDLHADMEPDVSRFMHEHRLVARLFALRPAASPHNAFTLYLIVNAKPITDSISRQAQVGRALHALLVPEAPETQRKPVHQPASQVEIPMTTA